MLEDRVEGRVDFTDVEYVVYADEKMRAEYFAEEGWAEVETFRAPSDIHEQLEKLDCMLRQDLEQLKIDKVEFEKRMRKGEEDRPILLYQFLRGR